MRKGEAARDGYLESYQRRYGRLPWEYAGGETAEECCIGLKRLRGDDSDLSFIEPGDYDSSPEVKADATALDGGAPAGVGTVDEGLASQTALGSEKLEQGLKSANLGETDGIRRRESDVEALKRARWVIDPYRRKIARGF